MYVRLYSYDVQNDIYDSQRHTDYLNLKLLLRILVETPNKVLDFDIQCQDLFALFVVENSIHTMKFTFVDNILNDFDWMPQTANLLNNTKSICSLNMFAFLKNFLFAYWLRHICYISQSISNMVDISVPFQKRFPQKFITEIWKIKFD